MKTEEKPIFVWYATHPHHGQLVLAIQNTNNYANSFIYCTRIIVDRLGHKPDAAECLELSLGPLGLIPRRCYQEAGFIVRTPLWLRLMALIDARRSRLNEDEEDTFITEHDHELTAFILDEWEKVYKDN